MFLDYNSRMSDASVKIRVGVLRGMAGEHYGDSLQKGADLISLIAENLAEKFKTSDIFIDKDYIWHLNGLPLTPGDLAHKVDVIWNTSHPSLNNIIESLYIPHVGVPAFSSGLEKSREMLREHMKKIGVKMTRHVLIPPYQEDFDARPHTPERSDGGRGPKEKYSIKKSKEIFEKFGAPWLVKSVAPDPNMAVHLAKTFPELVEAIEDGVNHERGLLVEEFISDRKVSVHSVPTFRGQDIYLFSPDNMREDEKKSAHDIMRGLHEHTGARYYLKSDFVFHPRRGVFLSGLSFSPEFKKDSHLEKSCESVGAKMHHVVEHILESALNLSK